MDGPRLRTLKRALVVAHGREPLALSLGLPPEVLDAYLAARMPLPDAVFMAALDIVASKNPKEKLARHRVVPRGRNPAAG